MSDAVASYQETLSGQCWWGNCIQQFNADSEVQLVADFVSHCQQQHGERYRPRDDNTHLCKWKDCGKTFKGGSHTFKMHVWRDFCRHYDLQPYNCPFCQTRFVAAQDQKRHMQNQHPTSLNEEAPPPQPVPDALQLESSQDEEMIDREKQSWNALKLLLIKVRDEHKIPLDDVISCFLKGKIYDYVQTLPPDESISTEDPSMMDAGSALRIILQNADADMMKQIVFQQSMLGSDGSNFAIPTSKLSGDQEFIGGEFQFDSDTYQQMASCFTNSVMMGDLLAYPHSASSTDTCGVPDFTGPPTRVSDNSGGGVVPTKSHLP